jgi:hypothetical protein
LLPSVSSAPAAARRANTRGDLQVGDDQPLEAQKWGGLEGAPLQLSDLTQPVVPVYVNGITTIVAASAAAWVGKRASLGSTTSTSRAVVAVTATVTLTRR